MCPDTPRFFCSGGKYKGFENCVFDPLIWTVKNFTITSRSATPQTKPYTSLKQDAQETTITMKELVD